MAWGPVEYQCSHCTAMFADQRERNYHEETCEGPEEDLLNAFINEIATASVNGGSE